MAELFSRTLYVGWSDLDSNGHMANTAYLSKVVDVRMMYFDEQGFTMRDFERLRLGPVVMRDDLEYFREFRMLEPIRITLSLAGLSEDGSRFRLRNEMFKEDGKLAARLTSTGGWLDLAARKLISPPDKLVEAVKNLIRSEDFEELSSSLKSG
jgi:acyl-CoA thioester hydrolase